MRSELGRRGAGGGRSWADRRGMSGRNPDEIWEQSVDEGVRRMGRTTPALFATGVVGGADVMIGILAMTVVSGALRVAAPEPIAHVGGSLVFGIGFVMLVVGRSELFTENFLVPVASVLRGRAGVGHLGRLWAITTLGNAVGIFALAAMLSRPGVVPPETLKAAGTVADTFAARDFGAALLSGIVA